jgi:tripartite-type tricarboxylate transporter receptor subunit TctC
MLTDLMSGEVQVMFGALNSAIPLFQAGKIRALGVAERQRLAQFKDLQTVNESLPGYEVTYWFGLLAPAGTPPDVVARYNTVLNEFLHAPKMVAELGKQGLVSSGGTPELLRDLIAHDLAKWQKIIRDAGITAE